MLVADLRMGTGIEAEARRVVGAPKPVRRDIRVRSTPAARMLPVRGSARDRWVRENCLSSGNGGLSAGDR